MTLAGTPLGDLVVAEWEMRAARPLSGSGGHGPSSRPTPEWRAWSKRRSTTWKISTGHPGASIDADSADQVLAGLAADRCRPTVVDQDRRGWEPGGLLLYAGACLGCGWLSDRHVEVENEAVEAALDHTHPGWETIPAVAHSPSGDDRDRQRKWEAMVRATYPPEWLDAGGPILTTRRTVAVDGIVMGTRHVPGRAPGGGYDLGTADQAGQMSLFAA